MKDFSSTWLDAINDILTNGQKVSPRDQLTFEIPQRTMVVDMRRPVLRVAERSLSYRFMVAEAFWILSGDNKVETIKPYNSHIAQFSDDGETFFGAYGPKIAEQFRYVVGKLEQDKDTRQAGLTLWRENPPATKDVPCTIAIFFNIRKGKLNCHVFMRSSDVWLGVPYDVFNFSMLSHMVCADFNVGKSEAEMISPGTLYLTAASSHLYQRNWVDAKACLMGKVLEQPQTPDALWQDTQELFNVLGYLSDTKPGHELRWWEQ